MKMSEKMKKLLSIVLCLLMLVQYVPVHAHAADTKTIYLNTGGSGLWDQGGAWFAAWTWGGSSAEAWVKFTTAGGGIYQATMPADRTGIKFVRMSKNAQDFSWDRVTGDGAGIWNETDNLTISGTDNLYTITGWGGLDGNWSHKHIPGAAATCVTPQTCTACGVQLAAATGHLNKKDDIKLTATCCTDGSKDIVCVDCGVPVETNVKIPANGPHTYTGACVAVPTRTLYFYVEYIEWEASFVDSSNQLLDYESKKNGNCYTLVVPVTATQYYVVSLFGGGGGDDDGNTYQNLPSNRDTLTVGRNGNATWTCSHPGYAAGKCALCGEACSHTGHSQESCSICGLTEGIHTYKSSVCTVCNAACPHTAYENGWCTACGKKCTHEGETASYNYCDEDWHESIYPCGYSTKNFHKISGDVCTACGGRVIYVNGPYLDYREGYLESATGTQWSISDDNDDYNGISYTVIPSDYNGTVRWGDCEFGESSVTTTVPADKNCIKLIYVDSSNYDVHWYSYPCTTHSYVDGVCSNCKEACSHNWEDGTCTKCAYECPHTSHNNSGDCDHCDVKVGHTYDAYGICTNDYCDVSCKHTDVADNICNACRMYQIHLFTTDGKQSYYNDYWDIRSDDIDIGIDLTDEGEDHFVGFLPANTGDSFHFTGGDSEVYDETDSQVFTFDGSFNAFRVIGFSSDRKYIIKTFTHPHNHSYANRTGACDACGLRCRHADGWDGDYECFDCGAECAHESYNSSTGKCNACGKACEHTTYYKGKCVACGSACPGHQLNDLGFCNVCDMRRIYVNEDTYYDSDDRVTLSFANYGSFDLSWSGQDGLWCGYVPDTDVSFKIYCYDSSYEDKSENLTLSDTVNCYRFTDLLHIDEYSATYNTVGYFHPCSHSQMENGKCPACGFICSHNWDESYDCTVCGMHHDHAFSNGDCFGCGKNCTEHQLDEKGFCTVCDMRLIYNDANDYDGISYTKVLVYCDSSAGQMTWDSEKGVWYAYISDTAEECSFVYYVEGYDDNFITAYMTVPETHNCFRPIEMHYSETTGVWYSYPCTNHDFTNKTGACDLCGAECAHDDESKLTCTPGTNAEKHNVTCGICGAMVPEENHTVAPAYTVNTQDNTKHDKTYSCCGTVATEGHTFDSATGKCSLCPANMAVASTTIGETTTYHRTLGEAIQAVASCTEADKAVVKLTADIDLGSGYQEITSGVFTIDLNGFELSGSSTSCGVLHISGNDAAKPDVTITGGTITGSQKSGVYVSNGTVTVTGSTITGNDYGIHASNSTVTIQDGEITGKDDGVKTTGGALTVTGGTVTGTGSNGIYVTTGTAAISGGKISGAYGVSAVQSCTLAISGGEISGSTYAVNTNKQCALTVTGGTITGELKIDGTLQLGLGQNDSGATFPGGLTVRGTTLNTSLAARAAYWQGDKMIVPADDAASITGGDVTIKAVCKHEDVTYPADRITADTHTKVCVCSCEFIENHDHKNGKCVCGEKATPTVTAPTALAGLEYTGNAQTLISAGSTTGGTIQYKLGADGTYGTELPTAVNAGEYTVYYKVVGNDNYKDVAEQSVTATVDKAPVPALLYPDVLNEITYGQKIEEAKLAFYSNSYGTFDWVEPTAVADSVGTISCYMAFYPTDLNNYKWDALNNWKAEYHAAWVEIDVIVNKAQGVGSVDMQDWIYGESAMIPQIQSETNGTDNVTVLYKVKGADDSTYIAERPADPGNYTIKVTFAATDNYTEVVATDDFTIEKMDLAASDLIFTRPSNLVYDGSVKTPTLQAANISLSTGMGAFTYEYYDSEGNLLNVSPINAGTYILKINATEGALYKAAQNLTADTWTFTIEKAQAVIDVDDTPIEVTYGETVVLPAAESNFGTVTCDLTPADMVNAGTYNVTYSVADTDNYHGARKTVAVTVNPKALTEDDVTLSGVLTYNGSEQTQAVTVTEGITYEVSGATATNAGDYTIKVTASGNHTGSVTKQWSIGKLDITNATVTLGDGLTYNGKEQTQGVAKVEIDGLSVTYDVSGNKQKNAGQYTMAIAGNGNFKGEVTASWSISKATLTVTAQDHSITYGDAPAHNGMTGNGFVNNENFVDLSGELAYGYDYEQFGNVGTYKITLGGLTSGNYEITYVPGKLNVVPKSIEVVADELTKTYGDADSALTYWVDGLVNEDTMSGALEREAGEAVGTYKIVLGTLSAGDNYTVSRFYDSTLTVAKRNLTVTVKDQSIAYGQSLSPAGYTITGVTPGQTAKVTLVPSTAKVTSGGSITAKVTVTDKDGNDVAANYNISTTVGKLEIAPNTAKIEDLTDKNVTSADEENIKAVMDQITAGGEDAQKAWKELTESCEKLIEKIEQVEAEKTVAMEDAADFDEDTVTSADKTKLEALSEDVEALLDSKNLTRAERTALEETLEQIQEMTEVLAETAAASDAATDAVEKLDAATVNSADKKVLEQAVADMDKLLAGKNLTEAERKTLTETKADAKAMLEVVEAAQAAAETDKTEKVENVTAENVKPEDKTALADAKVDLEKALKDHANNYTEAEKKAIQTEVQRIEAAVATLEHAETAVETIKELPETVEPDDEQAEEKILAAKAAYDALTDYEKSLVDETSVKKLNALVTGLTDYDIVKGDGGRWTQGSSQGLGFTANGAFSKFTMLKVDGKEVDKRYYDAKSGSTIITLKESYLKKLSAGKHTITVVYTNGETSGTFQIKSASDVPATGDNSNILFWTSSMTISLAALALLLVQRKKRTAK